MHKYNRETMLLVKSITTQALTLRMDGLSGKPQVDMTSMSSVEWNHVPGQVHHCSSPDCEDGQTV